MAKRPYNEKELKIAYEEIYRAFGDHTKYEGLTDGQKATVIERSITQWENSSTVRDNSVIRSRAYDEARKLMQEWNTLDFIEYKKGDGAKSQEDAPPPTQEPAAKKSNTKYYIIGAVALLGAVAIFFILNKKK